MISKLSKSLLFIKKSTCVCFISGMIQSVFLFLSESFRLLTLFFLPSLVGLKGCLVSVASLMFILFLFHRMKLILLFPWLALTIFTLEVRAISEKENKGIVESATVKETFIHVIQVDFLPCFVHELFIPQFICEVKGYLLLCRVT